MKQKYDAIKRSKRDNGRGLNDLDSNDDVSDNDTDDEASNNDNNIDNVPVVDIDDGANDKTPSVLLEENSSGRSQN